MAEGFNKPFNPLLAEQVSHHPPVTAWYCEAVEKSYRAWSQFETATKFTGQFLCFYQKYPTFIELSNGEVYRISTPTLSAHNLVFGNPYLDIGDRASVTRVIDSQGQRDGSLEFLVEFFRRGWFRQEENIYRCRGEVHLNG